MNSSKSLDPEVSRNNIKINGYQNAEINISIFEKKNHVTSNCLIYFHGGAFVYKENMAQFKVVCDYVKNVNCKAIFVSYRTANDYPFPTPVEDCYSALEWAYQSRESLGISKIAVAGDSAGGCLAAAVCQMARDRKGPEICFQLLAYPVLDSSHEYDSFKKFVDSPVWNPKANQKSWEIYLRNGTFGIPQYAAPLQSKNFKNLPNCFIDVAEFDCLKDQGLAYANKLKEEGVQVELYIVNGVCHGYDCINQPKSQQIIKLRCEALINAFAS